MRLWKCVSCGEEWDHEVFSHAVWRGQPFSHTASERRDSGEPIEVECGPIEEVIELNDVK